MAITVDSAEMKEQSNKKINDQPSHSRRILPQVIAATLKNFLTLDYGLSIAIISIIIPALREPNRGLNINETLYITPSEASWLGSISIPFKLLGCIISGWITEHLGRKRSLIVVNIPYAIAWWLLYNSSSVLQVFIGNAMLGFAVGLMKTPTVTYISESCETSIRGILNASDGIAANGGTVFVAVLSNFVDWRQISSICFALPIATIIGLLFIPESPMWLLSRNRDNQAKKSLQWLRGWVPEKTIRCEFEAMKQHQEFSSACPPCQKTKQQCDHPAPTMTKRFKELARKQTVKPAIILLISYSLSEICGIMHLLPYAVQILEVYHISIDPYWGTVVLSSSATCATVTIIIIVKFVGKRKIYLFALAGASLTHFSLSAYGFYWLPAGVTSYESENLKIDPKLASILPLIAFSFLRICTSGITMIPLMMFGELFPFKTRSLATGITTAFYYVFVFIANKTFVNVEGFVSLPGALAFYGTIGAIGWIVIYQILPETERRSMHDIEKHFANNRLGLTDRKIPKTPTTWAVDAVINFDEKIKASNERDHVQNVQSCQARPDRF